MARYIISQKYFSMRDRFTITDEAGRGYFQVEGKFWSIGKKFTVYNMQGQELYYIRQRLFRWFATFDIERGDERVARIKRRVSLFTKRLKLTSDYYGDFKIKGNVFGWDFRIEQDDQLAAMMSKKVFKIADTYVVDIAPGRDDALMLSAMIVLDCLYQKKH